MTSLWPDIRGAARLARRQPLFTSLLVVVLALGIAAAVAMFSVLNAVVLRELPYGRPQQLMWLWSMRPDGTRGPFSIQDFVDLRERETGCESLGAFANWSANLTGLGTAERLQGMRTSANAFAVLQVGAIVGRTIEPGDGDAGRTVVLGHGLWTRRFGGDPGVVGRALVLNGAPYTMVGVLPKSFVFPIRDAELAVPIVEADARRTEGDVAFLRVIGRLKPGVSAVRSEQYADPGRRRAPTASAARQRPQGGDSPDHPSRTDHRRLRGDAAAPLCGRDAGARRRVCQPRQPVARTNVGTAARVRRPDRARRQPIAARHATAHRDPPAHRVRRRGRARARRPGDRDCCSWRRPRRCLARPTRRSICAWCSFAIAVTLLTGLAVGLGPALHMSRVDPAAGLRGLGRASGGRRPLAIRRWLVAAEVAISLVLAVATAMLVQSFRQVQQVDPGFVTDHVLSMRVSLSATRYPSRSSVLAFQRRLEDRLRALPGAAAVGGASIVPLSGLRASVDFVIDGRPVPSDRVPEAEYRIISPQYFETMGIRLLKGRAFTDRDAAPAVDVAIVNKTMADRLWPGQSPVGSHLRIEPGSRIDQVVEVIGVVADVKHSGLEGDPTLDLYVPFAQLPEPSVVWITNNQFWVVRANGNPLARAAAARAALAEADPDVPAASVRTLEQAIDGTLAVRRFNVWLVALFGYAALALTACGIYAVSSHAVVERSRELGIRAALGASPRGLVALVLKTDFAGVVAGIGAGLVAARAVAAAIDGLLFQVRAGEPGPYAVVTMVIALVAACACYVPAARAARSDPLRVIRNE